MADKSTQDESDILPLEIIALIGTTLVDNLVREKLKRQKALIEKLQKNARGIFCGIRQFTEIDYEESRICHRCGTLLCEVESPSRCDRPEHQEIHYLRDLPYTGTDCSEEWVQDWCTFCEICFLVGSRRSSDHMWIGKTLPCIRKKRAPKKS